MRIRFALPLLLITSTAVLMSCAEPSRDKSASSFRDSVVSEYLRVIDSAGKYDTTDYTYKVLRAYHSNDTAFLREVKAAGLQYRVKWHPGDTCIPETKVQEMDVDEAYRFIYTPNFRPCKMNITVSKLYDNINLHFIIYQFAEDTATCRIISEYNKKLSNADWDNITKSVRKLDFWSLKDDKSEEMLLDPDKLVVIGYKRPAGAASAKFNYVHRFGAMRTSLGDLFISVLKLSGNKKECR